MDEAKAAARIGWAEKIVILFGGMAAALTVVGLSTVLPQIEAALAHGTEDKLFVKLLVPISGFAMVAGAPLAGFLVDRIGLRRFLLGSCIAYMLLGTTGLYLSDLRLLLASRLFLGVFAASIATTAMILINTRLDGTERAKWMGLHVAVATLGSLVLFPILGALGEIGWRWPFLSYGAAGLALGLVSLGLRSHERPALPGDTGGAAKVPLLRWFPFRFAAIAFLVGSLNIIPAVYLSFVVHEVGGHSSANTAMLMMGSSLAGAGFSVLFGRIARVLDWRRIFVAGFLLAAAGHGLLAAASSLPFIAVANVIAGMSIGWLVPNMMTAAAHETEPAFQSRVTGIMKGAQYFAQPVAVLLIDPVARQFGPHGPFGAASVLSALALAWFLLSALAGSGVARKKEAA
jgi:MFS family permease